MVRSAVRKIEDPPRRKAQDTIIFIGIAITLLFALVGLVSAGSFVANKVSGGSKSHTTSDSRGGQASASRQLAAAQVQATQIIRAARTAEHSIVSSATLKANRRANTIIKNAQRAANRTRAAAVAAASSSSSGAASTGSTSAPAANSTSNGTSSTGSTGYTPTAGVGSASSSGVGSASTSSGVAAPSTGVQTYSTPVASSPPIPANLVGLPASWKVVGYNATFGSGPGNAGSITVTNRGTKLLSGTARVAYTGGGSASASFQGIAPGQTVVLPLNGVLYPGHGYHIEMLGVH